MAKSTDSQQSIAQQFLADTANLSPEARNRVLETISKASQVRDARLAGKVTPLKPKAKG